MQETATTTAQLFETSDNTSLIEVTFGEVNFTPGASTDYYTVVKFTETDKTTVVFTRKTAGAGTAVSSLPNLVIENPTADPFTAAVTVTATVYYKTA